MSKGLAVELYFARESSSRIEALMTKVESPLLPLGFTPHISLSGHSLDEESELIEAVKEFSRKVNEFNLQISSVGLFPSNEGVVYLSPAPTISLLRMHSDFHALLLEKKLVSNKYYLPGAWVPHITVTQGVDSLKLENTIRNSIVSGVFGAAKVVSLGVIRYAPVETLYRTDIPDGR